MGGEAVSPPARKAALGARATAGAARSESRRGERVLGDGAGPSASRREALRVAFVAGAAAALFRPAAAAAQTSDVEQLARLLVLEQRLASLYEAALTRDAIDPRLGRTLLEHEREHVRGLEETLRARGRRAPQATAPLPRFGAALASRQAFARFAIDLESETVRTYQEVLATLRNTRLLLPLGSIMTSGAQHVVALREAAGEDLLARP
jgi:rubrerythrin